MVTSVFQPERERKHKKEPLTELSDGNMTVRRGRGSISEGNLLEAVVESDFTN